MLFSGIRPLRTPFLIAWAGCSRAGCARKKGQTPDTYWLRQAPLLLVDGNRVSPSRLVYWIAVPRASLISALVSTAYQSSAFIFHEQDSVSREQSVCVCVCVCVCSDISSLLLRRCPANVRSIRPGPRPLSMRPQRAATTAR